MADTSQPKVVFVFDHENKVNHVAISPNTTTIASASCDFSVKLWNIQDGTLLGTLVGHSNSVFAIAFSPDGKKLVSASYDKTVRIWLIESQRQLKVYAHKDAVDTVAWSSNGKIIASGSRDQTIILGDADSGQPQKTLSGHSRLVLHVSFSKDSKKLVSAGQDQVAIIWDTLSGAVLMKLSHLEAVRSVCFSRDDRYVFSACFDNAVHLFDTMTGRETAQFTGHTDTVLSVNASFDGSMIISCSSDRSIRIWDVASSWQLHQLEGHTDLVMSAVFSRDGKYIISGSWDGTVCVWNPPTSQQIKTSLLKGACFDGNVNNAIRYLNEGALINDTTSGGSSALHFASSKGHLQCVQMLIEHRADIHLFDHDANTALFLAIANNHVDVVEYLLQNGALVNQKTADGQIMLEKAINSNNLTLISLLLQYGADINIQNEFNQSGWQLVNKPQSVDILIAFNDASILEDSNLNSIEASNLNKNVPFTLRLANNNLGSDVWDTLTSSSACMQFLVALFLQSNPSLGAVPDNVAKLGQLMSLSMTNCDLSASISALSSLPNLRSLDLSFNPLNDLPAEFSRLKKLCMLNVSECNLSLVPLVIIQLEQLRDLDISNNHRIHHIPVALASLKYLTRITLSGCPLTAIPFKYHNAPTSKLLQYLKDLGEQSQPVYRSKLLLVGYGGVGKTTLLSALFPLSAILLKKSGSLMKTWEQRRCKIEANKLVYERPTKNGGWEKPEEMNLLGVTIEVDKTDQVTWFVQLKNQKHEFRCQTGLERAEWVKACKFQALNSATPGISMMYRDISHSELQSALNDSTNPAPSNRVPKHKTLQLALCDFAGQHEYQDGHQLFLTSQSVYLVLWDVTPTKRAAELAKLRHWLVTLQLQLGSDQLRNSVLIYIVGTHADASDADLDECAEQTTKVIEAVQLSVPYRLIPGIDVRNPQHVSSLKQQLLADLAVQAHLGEEVPTSYLDLDQHVRLLQDEYRLQLIQNQSLDKSSSSLRKYSVPLLKRADLMEQLKLNEALMSRCLSLLHFWGQIIYFGHMNSRFHLDELVVSVPEWLAVSVLGSVALMLQSKRKNNDYSPILEHRKLITLFPTWNFLTTEQQEQVFELFYAFDLGFNCDPASLQPFIERSSVFPKLLPLKPPRQLEWKPTTTTPEITLVVELNGIPMGFHTVLLSRLNSYFSQVDYTRSWQSGYLFHGSEQATLVTVHEDLLRVRFCVRNSRDFGQVFQSILGTVTCPGIFRKVISDRYQGLRIVNEYIECVCDSCQSTRKWRWHVDLANQVDRDKNIQDLMENTTARADFSEALLKHIQPNGRPHEFPISAVLAAVNSPDLSMMCKKSSQAVSIASLTQQKALLTDGSVDLLLLSRLLGLQQISPLPSNFPSRVALVVGNDKYPQNPLCHAVSGAKAVRDRLSELGFQTIDVFNGTKKQISAASLQLAENVYQQYLRGGEGVLSVIYFSGHACQHDGVNWFVASDGEEFSLQEIFDRLKDINNTFPHPFPVFIILDGCRVDEGPLSVIKFKTNLEHLFLYSCQSGEWASDDPAFARSVHKHLQPSRSLADFCSDVMTDRDCDHTSLSNNCHKKIIL